MKVIALLRLAPNVALLTFFAFLNGLPIESSAASNKQNKTYVAIASNFISAGKEIAAAFEKETGHKAILSFGSTGKLYIQISNGAPFEVFLSADTQTAKRVEAEGLTVLGSRFTYAVGKIVLYSANPGLIDTEGKVLGDPTAFSRLAMANPKTAPYGRAALEALIKLELHTDVKGKIVNGNNITQAFQFIFTGNAELGFVALSQLKFILGGSRWLPPQNLYTPLKQDAVLLKRGEKNKAAMAFVKFLKSEKARAIIKQYGYGTK